MYECCELCERRCRINREKGELGFCGMSSDISIARAALHMWEEPPISGSRGSGAIFFSGCSLRCIYCQNREISRGASGKTVTVERLCRIMLELEEKGAHNINLVTPTHYTPSIIKAVAMAREQGMRLPIVYNTGSYETESTVDSLKGTVDVWLPDIKYYKSETAALFSSAPSLPAVSRRAIDKMVEISGTPVFDENGIMQRGVIVRILLLPGHLAEAKLNLSYLYKKYGDSVYLSLMSQYTPIGSLPPPLNRKVSRAEYCELVNYAIKLGVRNAFTQDFESAQESFIPPFDKEGV